MVSPKVSIVVPIYNVEPYLEQCVNSIRNQTMREIEIILVDDGSPDLCPKMCDRYAEKDSRIHVIHQENAGVSVARNRGMELASAEWIMFVDPDDWLELDAVRVLYEKATHTESDVVCGSYYINYPSKQKQARPRRDLIGEYQVSQNLSILLGGVVGDQCEPLNALGSPWGKIYKRKMLVKSGTIFPSGLKRKQDWVFNLHAVFHSQKILIIKTPVYHYRIWMGSARHKLFENQIEIYRHLHTEMLDFMDEFKIHKEFQIHFDYVVISSILELSKLMGTNMENAIDFRSCIILLKNFGNEADCRKAIKEIPVSFIKNKRKKFFCWLLKHNMYRTIILLCFVWGKMSVHQ